MPRIFYRPLLNLKRGLFAAIFFIFSWAFYVEIFLIPGIHKNQVPFVVACVRDFVRGIFKGWQFLLGTGGDSLPQAYNSFEVFLWGWIGIGLVLYFSFKGGWHRNRGIGAGGLFLLFSLSDAIEVQTGAWWSPVWLLLWKVLNIIGFIAVYLNYKRAGNKD